MTTAIICLLPHLSSSRRRCHHLLSSNGVLPPPGTDEGEDTPHSQKTCEESCSTETLKNKRYKVFTSGRNNTWSTLKKGGKGRQSGWRVRQVKAERGETSMMSAVVDLVLAMRRLSWRRHLLNVKQLFGTCVRSEVKLQTAGKTLHHVCRQVSLCRHGYRKQTAEWGQVTSRSSQNVWNFWNKHNNSWSVYAELNDSSDRKWLFHLHIISSSSLPPLLMQLVFLFKAAATLHFQLTPGQMPRKTWSSRNHQQISLAFHWDRKQP